MKGDGTLALPGFLKLQFSMVLRLNCGGIHPFVLTTAPPIPMAFIARFTEGTFGCAIPIQAKAMMVEVRLRT